MILRTFSATLQLNPTLELYVTTYWDAKTHPAEPHSGPVLVSDAPAQVLGRTQMPLRFNEALERWKQVAQLAGSRFTLEGLLERLIKDPELGACRIVVQDSNGQGAEAYHSERWAKFIGSGGVAPAGARRTIPAESGPDYGTPDTPA